MQSRTYGTATFINGLSTGSTKQSNFYSKSPFGGFRGLPAKNCCISVVAWKMQQFATTPNEPTILQEIPCSLQVKTYYENNSVVAFRHRLENATICNNLRTLILKQTTCLLPVKIYCKNSATVAFPVLRQKMQQLSLWQYKANDDFLSYHLITLLPCYPITLFTHNPY